MMRFIEKYSKGKKIPPKQVPQKGRLSKEIEKKCTKILYGDFALKAAETGTISSSQYKSILENILKKVRKVYPMYVLFNPGQIPLTQKPVKVRMGKGNGKIYKHSIAKIKKERILFEIKGCNNNTAKHIFKKISNKLSIKTTVITNKK